jgi:hypothetical protein
MNFRQLKVIKECEKMCAAVEGTEVLRGKLI